MDSGSRGASIMRFDAQQTQRSTDAVNGLIWCDWGLAGRPPETPRRARLCRKSIDLIGRAPAAGEALTQHILILEFTYY